MSDWRQIFDPKYRQWWTAISLCAIIGGVILAFRSQLTFETFSAILLIHLGGGFFYPLTIGAVIRKALDEESVSLQKAGLIRVYPEREGEAKEAIERGFLDHTQEDILLIGPSLRIFLPTGGEFFKSIKKTLIKESAVSINAIVSDASANSELAIRSFVEEFEMDGTFQKGVPRGFLPWVKEEGFEWDISGAVDLARFCRGYHARYRKDSPDADRCRCVSNIVEAEDGARALNMEVGRAAVTLRGTLAAPYFTAVIFPDKCFYTPNLLFHDPPANMPVLVFLRGSVNYDKIRSHFRFLWHTGTNLTIGKDAKNV